MSLHGGIPCGEGVLFEFQVPVSCPLLRCNRRDAAY